MEGGPEEGLEFLRDYVVCAFGNEGDARGIAENTLDRRLGAINEASISRLEIFLGP